MIVSVSVIGERMTGVGEADAVERHARAEYHLVDEAAAVSPPPFRFSRLGPVNGVHPDEELRRKLALILARGIKSEDGHILAGYTYLGQFIDHDLTFDRTPLSPDLVPVEQLITERSPTLDLDSVYGYGPSVTPQYYQDSVGKLRVGSTEATPGSPLTDREYPGHDLPRDANQKLAVIPDHRNDENLLVAQLAHLPFVRLHNAFMDDLEREGVPPARRYALARRKVILHYHWMIRNDYLPNVVEPKIVTDVFKRGRKVVDPTPIAGAAPTMPVEFSVACFRFGHSMVRDRYGLNRTRDDLLTLLFRLSGTSGLLGLGRRLPSQYIADLDNFFDFTTGPVGPLAIRVHDNDNNPQLAFKMDPRINVALRNLSDGAIGGPNAAPLRHNLAYRNLERAARLSLATGQQLRKVVADCGVTVPKLSSRQIMEQLALLPGGDLPDPHLSTLTAADRKLVGEHTPLWVYVLAESARFESSDGSGRMMMTGVGGRIVVETIHRAMEATEISPLQEPNWHPSTGPNPRTCRMTDLIIYPFGTDTKKLRPVHDAPDELQDATFEQS